MARKSRRSSALPRALVALVAVAALLFLAGQAWVLARSGSGQVAQARWGLRAPERLVPLFAREIRAGVVAVNCFGEGDLTTPFGGFKESGFFGRDKSSYAQEQYTELKTVWMQL